MRWYIKLVTIVVLLSIALAALFFLSQKPKENREPQDVTTVAKSVLIALKNKDYATLESLTSSEGLSFNEIPNLDLSKNDISKSEISNISTNTQKYLFGYTDGKGDPINLTQSDYFDKYIYNHDYINADEVGVNKIIDGGTNSLNTIVKDSTGRTFVAFHFKGFNPKYEGMDWTTIYLVFDFEKGEYKLRGIAKSNWTI